MQSFEAAELAQCEYVRKKSSAGLGLDPLKLLSLSQGQECCLCAAREAAAAQPSQSSPASPAQPSPAQQLTCVITPPDVT